MRGSIALRRTQIAGAGELRERLVEPPFGVQRAAEVVEERRFPPSGGGLRRSYRDRGRLPGPTQLRGRFRLGEGEHVDGIHGQRIESCRERASDAARSK